MSSVIVPPSIMADAGAIQIIAAKADPCYFIFEQCITEDHHDHVTPLKHFPRKAYLEFIIKTWTAVTDTGRWLYPVLLIPKSRQMLLTWLMLALQLWLALTRMSQRIYIQAQKQEDAEELLERLMVIYENLERSFRKSIRVIKSTMGKIRFSNRSEIMALAQGPNQIRQKAASSILIDEAAFHEMLEDAYRASKPTILGGGRLTMLSSAEEGYMCELVHDRVVMSGVAA